MFGIPVVFKNNENLVRTINVLKVLIIERIERN